MNYTEYHNWLKASPDLPGGSVNEWAYTLGITVVAGKYTQNGKVRCLQGNLLRACFVTGETRGDYLEALEKGVYMTTTWGSYSLVVMCAKRIDTVEVPTEQRNPTKKQLIPKGNLANRQRIA